MTIDPSSCIRATGLVSCMYNHDTSEQTQTHAHVKNLNYVQATAEVTATEPSSSRSVKEHPGPSHSVEQSPGPSHSVEQSPGPSSSHSVEQSPQQLTEASQTTNDTEQFPTMPVAHSSSDSDSDIPSISVTAEPVC